MLAVILSEKYFTTSSVHNWKPLSSNGEPVGQTIKPSPPGPRVLPSSASWRRWRVLTLNVLARPFLILMLPRIFLPGSLSHLSSHSSLAFCFCLFLLMADGWLMTYLLLRKPSKKKVGGPQPTTAPPGFPFWVLVSFGLARANSHKATVSVHSYGTVPFR